MKLLNTIKNIIEEQDKWISTEDKNFVMKHKKYIADCTKDPNKHKFCKKLLSLVDVTSTTTKTTKVLPENTMAASTRKGRGNWSPESEQDLYAFHPELKKDISLEEDFIEEDYELRDTFTATDRRMLHAIYDVLIKGGAGGGYKGGRKRSIAPLGHLYDN
jgi:hypothetical protein